MATATTAKKRYRSTYTYTPPPPAWADTYSDEVNPDVDWVKVTRALTAYDGGRAAKALTRVEFVEAVWQARLRYGLSPTATAKLLRRNERDVRAIVDPTYPYAAEPALLECAA